MRPMAIAVCVLLLCLGFQPATRNLAAAANPKVTLDGGFVQLNDDALKFTPQQWKQLVDQMKAVGMKYLIVQSLSKSTGPDKAADFLYPVNQGTDPVRVILKEAKANKMSVYLGLVDPPLAGKDKPSNALPGYWDAAKLTSFAKANADFAVKVREAYRKDPAYDAFDGWYIPLENWVGCYPVKDAGPATENPAAWTAFFRTISKQCKDLNQLDQKIRPVAISPCLPEFPLRRSFPVKGPNEDYSAAAADVYAEIIRGSGIDVVMLQDSVGERALEAKPAGEKDYPGPLTIDVSKRYLKELTEAIADVDPKIEVWANVESFIQYAPRQRRACDFSRLKAQLEATDQLVQRRVTFDFLHYMSNDLPIGGDIAARKKLGTEYKAYRGAP